MKITLPLALYLPRKTKKDKRVSLSMNTYRNLHYIVNNKIKKQYHDIVAEQIGENIGDPIRSMYIHIDLWRDNKRDIDLDNRCIVQSKFAADALVHLWYIPDDNIHYIANISYTYRWYDKGNWRCEVQCFKLDDILMEIDYDYDKAKEKIKEKMKEYESWKIDELELVENINKFSVIIKEILYKKNIEKE